METKLTKTQVNAEAREIVMAGFTELDTLLQTDTATFVKPITVHGEEKFVEIKFVVKGDAYDINDALVAFEDKKAKAVERETEKAKKAAERLAKEAAKAAKAKEKESKAE